MENSPAFKEVLERFFFLCRIIWNSAKIAKIAYQKKLFLFQLKCHTRQKNFFSFFGGETLARRKIASEEGAEKKTRARLWYYSIHNREQTLAKKKKLRTQQFHEKKKELRGQ